MYLTNLKYEKSIEVDLNQLQDVKCCHDIVIF